MRPIKILILGTFLLTSINLINAQQIFLREKFNNLISPNLPGGWLATGNGGWRSGTEQELNIFFNGVHPDSGAVAVYEFDVDHNYLNEKLITPSIDCSTAPNGNLYAIFDLAFRKSSYDSTETLKLFLSSDNGSNWTLIQDFDGYPDFGMHRKYVNLSTYAGQSNLKLAFCYSDHHDWILGAVIDNFSVQTLPAADMALVSASTEVGGENIAYCVPNANVLIKSAVFNASSETVTKCVLRYQQGTSSIKSDTITGLNIPPLGTDTFTHNIPFIPTATGNYPIKIWIDTEGDIIHANDSMLVIIKCVPSLPVKRLVFEESTGTWCGNCVRGIVSMERFAENHPGTAAQIAVHGGDPSEPMYMGAYDTCMSKWTKFGYPTFVLDRRFVLPGENMNEAYNQFKNDFAYADITLGTPVISGTQVSIPVSVSPVLDINNAFLTFVITESNVSGPLNSPAWGQHNYCSGLSGDWGGFESQPEIVYNLRFHFVARSITPQPFGESCGLPATMTGGQTYNTTVSATINPAWNLANLQYIVMLINSADSSILNSNFTALPVLQPIFTSIQNSEWLSDKISVYPNPVNDILNIDFKGLNDFENVSITLMDAGGKRIFLDQKNIISNNHPVSYSMQNLENGIYFLLIETPQAFYTRKVMIAR